MWPLLRFLFWSSAATLALATLLFWDEWIKPEQAVIGKKEASRSDRPDKAGALSTEDKARAADIDRLSVLLKDINPSGATPEPAAKAPESKGLFEEMLSNAESSAATTPSQTEAQKNAPAGKEAKETGEQPLLLPLDDGKPLDVNSANGSNKSDGASSGSVPSSLPSSGLSTSADLYKAMTGFDYPTAANADNSAAGSAASAAPSNPLSAAIQRNQTNSLSSLSAQSETLAYPPAQSAISPTIPPVIQPTYPSAMSWQTQTPGVTSFSNPYAGSQFAPTLPGQLSSPNNGGLSGRSALTPGLTPGTAANANPAGNSYSYLTGGQPDGLGTNAGQGLMPSQVPGSANNSGASMNYGSSDSTSLTPAAASPYGRSPYSGANQGTGWTSAPNTGRSPYSGTTPGTGWTSAPPVSPLLPATPSNFGQSSLPSSNPGSGLAAPQAVSPLIPAGTSSYGQVPTPSSNPGSGSRNSGLLQVTVPIVPANSGQSALPSFGSGTGASTPGTPYNYGNSGVQPLQPSQTPSSSVPRPIPGRYIGGGQINTFSNP